MSKFISKQGKPAGSGIKKGQKQTRTLIKQSVYSILKGMGKHPVVELMKLMNQLEPKEQARVWLELQKYVSPQLSAVQVTDDRDEDDEDAIDVTPLTTEELIEAVTKDGNK